jgi:Flp pilus assembly protein TadG
MVRWKKPIRSNRNLAALGRDEGGAAAVEFGLVAAPFFAVLFAILQIGLIFLTGQVLDNATSDAARMIRTGEVHDAGLDENGFRGLICGGAAILPNCQANLRIDVRRVANFAGAVMAGDTSSGQLDEAGFGYDIGNGGDIVVVRAFYEWPIWVPFMSVPDGQPVQYSDLASGNFMLTSALVFRNEPF